jgi:hypothetical protein
MRGPQKRKKEIADENKEIDRLIKECINALKKHIDPLMKLACEDNARLLYEYESKRKVLPKGSGRISEREQRYRDSRKRKKKK